MTFSSLPGPGGPIQDLFDFRLFSLHLAAPKTTRLLLPAYVNMKSYVDSSTLTRPQNNDFRGQASSPCSLSRRPPSRKLDFHKKIVARPSKDQI